jgi:hypothetical protein
MPPTTVTMIDPDGRAHDVPSDAVQGAIAQGFRVETDEGRVGRIATDSKDAYYSAPGAQVVAGGAAVLRGVTLGLSDVGLRAIYGEEGRRDLEGLREANPTLSTAGELGGALLTAIPSGGTSLAARAPAAAAARLGSRVAGLGEGAGAVGRIGASAAGAALEGGIYGAGQGISELALSDDPLTVEHAASVLSSHALYGAAVGGVAGAATKGVEVGLGRARRAIDDFAAKRQAVADVPEDLAAMDAKQLRAAHAAEKESIATARADELEQLKVTRATESKQLADDIIAYRTEVRGMRHSNTTDGVKLANAEGKASLGELGLLGKTSNNQLGRVVSNPTGLAENPGRALDALQRQENAMVKLLEREPELRAAYGSSSRAAERTAALDSVPTALEKNRALQQRIRDATAPIKTATPEASARLTAIDAARDTLAMGGGKKTLAEQMLGGSVFGATTGVVGAIPGLGMAAPFIGAKAADLVTGQVFGRMRSAAAGGTARIAKAVASFSGAASKAGKLAPPLATRILATTRYSTESAAPTSKAKLADHFLARSEEIRGQTAYDEMGVPRMRPEARAKIAAHLAPVATVDPLLADRLETAAARRIEFLASKLPRRPELGVLVGPDRWRPSSMEMRKFARYVAATEDPYGVVERLTDGMVTPEDAEAVQAVYPEIHADVTRQILETLPARKSTLPYRRQLALSIFTGVPIAASTDPMVIAALQATFAGEEGSAGGTQAPVASPAFGSVTKPEPTPAQQGAS